MNYKKEEKQTLSLQMVEINRNNFAIENIDGNVRVNLSQMAKPFGKKPNDWIKYQYSKDYLNGLSKVINIPLVDLLKVRKGGSPGEAGTWAMDYRIAMRFAQWLSPEFSIAVDELLVKMLTQKNEKQAEPFLGLDAVMVDGRPFYEYIEVLRRSGLSSQSGSVSARRRRHPSEFCLLGGVWRISGEYAGYVTDYRRFREQQALFNQRRQIYLASLELKQLAIDFGQSQKGGRHES